MRKQTLLSILLAAALPLSIAACTDSVDNPGGEDVDAGTEDDPLTSIVDTLPAGSLEELHREIIAPRCSGEPGLCHNGQFEPNLSTPGNTYAYLVNRPATENFGVLRVNPNDPASSFLIDKLRNRNNVSTQMPLGADPLTEEEIVRFEDWISSGALRAPDADPAPDLNNPPKVPEIAFFDGTTRIDQPGTFSVAPGTTVTLRMSVADFETPDDQIFIALGVMQGPSGNLVLSPAAQGTDKANGIAVYDPAAPMGNGDLLNYFVDIPIGTNIDVVDGAGTVTTISSSNEMFTPIVLYADTATGIVSFAIGTSTMVIE